MMDLKNHTERLYSSLNKISWRNILIINTTAYSGVFPVDSKVHSNYIISQFYWIT